MNTEIFPIFRTARRYLGVCAATLLSATSVKVGERTLEAKTVIVATGARARELPHLKADGERVWTYRHALVPPAMPTEIAVAAPRSAEPTPALPAATPHPTAQRASTEAIDSYRRQLTDLFAREHEYPRVAAMRGWEGEVRLRLRVARRGQLLGVRVDRSSGFEVLDQDALALLEGHGKLPPLPEALEVAEIEVVVPITYRLRKAT